MIKRQSTNSNPQAFIPQEKTLYENKTPSEMRDTFLIWIPKKMKPIEQEKLEKLGIKTESDKMTQACIFSSGSKKINIPERYLHLFFSDFDGETPGVITNEWVIKNNCCLRWLIYRNQTKYQLATNAIVQKKRAHATEKRKIPRREVSLFGNYNKFYGDDGCLDIYQLDEPVDIIPPAIITNEESKRTQKRAVSKEVQSDEKSEENDAKMKKESVSSYEDALGLLRKRYNVVEYKTDEKSDLKILHLSAKNI